MDFRISDPRILISINLIESWVLQFQDPMDFRISDPKIQSPSYSGLEIQIQDILDSKILNPPNLEYLGLEILKSMIHSMIDDEIQEYQ